MSKTFIINSFDGSIVTAINAADEAEALSLFVKSQAQSETLREAVGSFAVNDGLLEQFVHDEKGDFFDDETGEVVKRLANMSDDECRKYIDEHVRKNVELFWKDKPHIAAEYYAAYLNSLTNWGDTPQFSEELYEAAAWALIVEGTSWLGKIEIRELVLKDKEVFVIFEE